MKKLPIAMQTDIVSECWTFYKLAVMETHPRGEEWIASQRMGPFLEEEGYYCVFGEANEICPLSYYNDILTMAEIPVQSPDMIVELVRQILDEERYVLMDFDVRRLYGGVAEELPIIHETLLYGYDEEKQVFYNPVLIHNQWTENELPFDMLKRSFSFVWNFLQDHAEKRLERRKWNFPATSIALNPGYRNDNACYDFIKKLEEEPKVGQVAKSSYTEDGKKEGKGCIVYRGSYVLLALRDRLLPMVKQGMAREDRAMLAMACLKLREHRKLLQRSIDFFIHSRRRAGCDTTAMCRCYERYRECFNEMDILHALSLKYEGTGDENLLRSMTERLEKQYSLEYGVLEDSIEEAKSLI